MTRVKPDKATFTVRPSDVEKMDPELRAALEVFFTEQQKQDAIEEEEAGRAYQSEQADVVLSQPGWSEIRADWLDEALNIRDRSSHMKVSEAVRTKVRSDDGREFNLLALPDQPTIHQFYRDLYGIEADGASRLSLQLSYPDRYGYPVEVARAARVVGRPYPEPTIYENDMLGCVPVLVNHRDRQHPYQVYENYDEFIDAVQKETSFIYLGRFWEPTRKDGKTFSISKKNAMTHINGVCIDIDRVEDDKGQHFDAKWVMNSLFEFLNSRPDLMPNYLMLSGTGIQLWYVFGQSIPLLSKKAPRRAKYDRFIKHLYAYFDERLPKNRFKVDKACGAYNHAFRAPGSPSKLGYPARLFVLGGTKRKMIDPIALSHSVGASLEPYDVGDWDPELFARLTGAGDGDGRDRPASEKQLGYIRKLHDIGCIEDEVFDKVGDMSLADADAVIKRAESLFTRVLHYRETHGCVETSNGHTVPLRPRNRSLYDYTLKRIFEETKPGSRYMSMFVLAGIAYNCSVSKSALEHDFDTLMNSEWGRKLSPTDGKPITRQDVKSALKGYNPLGCLRPKEMIEDVVGWSYSPSAKRNGRNRKDHLWADWYIKDEDGSYKKVVNTARDNRRLASVKSRDCAAKVKHDSSIERLSRYLSEHPRASKRAACNDLGMSRTTVTKYWSKACSDASIEDTRTGNHRPF